MRLLYVLALLPLVASAQTPVPTTACPCASYGPFPCAAVTLVALADQSGSLGLTSAQVDDLQSLRDRHLRGIHDILGDIGALQEAVHQLDRPYDADEVFALFYDLGHHEAELDGAFRAAESVMLQVLDDRQRERWDAIVYEAAALQETTLECTDDLVLGPPSPKSQLP